MKVFIPTKGRAKTIRTHKLFSNSIVVVHNKTEAEEYIRYNPELKKRIVVSDAKIDPYGLTRQREFVCENLVAKDEWFLFADDNIRRIRAVVEPFYGQELADVTLNNCPAWRERFNVVCDEKRFFDRICKDTIDFCWKVGAHLAGFSLTDNVLFRRKKFTQCAYVIGKMMLWHNTLKIPFNHQISMEDFYHTAMHLKVYGACVVNNFSQPTAGHYEPGGMGKYEERLPIRRKDVQVLMKMFPGLFNIRKHEGFEHATDLALKIHNKKKLEVWRKELNSSRLI